MVKLVGIDEAGRGPAIGPLVICGALIDEKDEKKLKQLGAKDSKELTPNQRESLFEEIKSTLLDYKIIIVQPSEIDAAVDSETDNLNWLEARKSAEIINALKPNKAILDCPSNNVEAYSDFVNKMVKHPVSLVAEHKADANYPVVSAASILAKVTRDREIEKIEQKLGQKIGSGYPSDPYTVEFMQKNYKKHAEIFRKSWQSYKNLQKGAAQSRLGDF